MKIQAFRFNLLLFLSITMFASCASIPTEVAETKAEKTIISDCYLEIKSEVEGVEVQSVTIQQVEKSFLQVAIEKQLAAQKGEEYAPPMPKKIIKKLWTSEKKLEKFKMLPQKYTITLSKECYETQEINIDFSKTEKYSIQLKKGDWNKYAYLRIENRSDIDEPIEVEFSDIKKTINANENLVKKLSLGKYGLLFTPVSNFKSKRSTDVSLCNENEIVILNIKTPKPEKTEIQKSQDILIYHGVGSLTVLSEKSNELIQIFDKNIYLLLNSLNENISNIEAKLSTAEGDSYSQNIEKDKKLNTYLEQLQQNKSSIIKKSLVLKTPIVIDKIPAGNYVLLQNDIMRELIIKDGDRKIITLK